MDPRRVARRMRLAGHVQGVGFRPFVYRLANELSLSGTVRNLQGEVEVTVCGAPDAIERFACEVITRAPPLARPRVLAVSEASNVPEHGFVILPSAACDAGRIFVPPDLFTCDTCLAELSDPSNRRYRYPFINCTQCGPRYTLIDTLPYDRANTTMAGFVLCPQCRVEYEEPNDRRFHAEPVACAECGPSLWLESGGRAADTVVREAPPAPLHGESALARAVALLLAGKILAVRGVGGYHLLCDAACDAAVARLRERKRRPGKPLAVMFPQSGADGLERLRREVELTAIEAEALVSPVRPIVLVPRREESGLSPLIAPGLSDIGVFLPYSPLHHLLLADVGRPLVATSGNVSGEPVMTEIASARRHLSTIADACLHHDRPIARPADDSLARSVLGRMRAIRLGRGLAPLELSRPSRLARPVLATGGHLKTTIALAWDDRVVVSPHIGDMGTRRSVEVFSQVAEDLQRLYGVRAAELVCDAHPDYATTRWALESGMPVTRVLHHHAHASAVAGECGERDLMLVFAWDGLGVGDDGTLWGGETFLGIPGRWRRVASLRPFRLPGAERAATQPWRSAAGICWEIGAEPPQPRPDARVQAAWRRHVNSPWSSAAGRLFDAAAAIVLGVRQATYEGEAPMRLEAAALRAPDAAVEALHGTRLTAYEDAAGLLRIDWQPLIAEMLRGERDCAERAARFHGALAAAIGAVADRLRAPGLGRVGLTGGVFQNSLLTKLAHQALTARGFQVCLPEHVPCNDGGLSFGQIIEFAGRACEPNGAAAASMA